MRNISSLTLAGKKNILWRDKDSNTRSELQELYIKY